MIEHEHTWELYTTETIDNVAWADTATCSCGATRSLDSFMHLPAESAVHKSPAELEELLNREDEDESDTD